MTQLKKYIILKPFSTTLDGEAITDETLTDEQAARLLEIPYMAQYIEVKPETQKAKKDDKGD